MFWYKLFISQIINNRDIIRSDRVIKKPKKKKKKKLSGLVTMNLFYSVTVKYVLR